MQDTLLYNKLSSLPDKMKAEVADFIEFLLAKAQKESNQENKPKAKFGSGKGMFIIHDDFDAPLDDFKDYM